MTGRKPPRLLVSELTGRAYIVTAYTEYPDGRLVARTKFDVTDELNVIVERRIAERTATLDADILPDDSWHP